MDDDMFGPAATAARPQPAPQPEARPDATQIHAQQVVLTGEGVRELLERVVMLHNVALGAHEQAAALDRFTAALMDKQSGMPRLIEEMILLRGAITNKMSKI